VKEGAHIKNLGVLKGFDIIKYPSYVEVRKVYKEEHGKAKEPFVVGRGTKFDGQNEAGTVPNASNTVKETSLSQQIADARAECNRTAPTYAYKYFSEKHMATLRDGPRSDTGTELS